MKSVWMFTLNGADEQRLSIPKGAEILTTQVRSNRACLFVLADNEAEEESRIFCTYNTGLPINPIDNIKYINTYRLVNEPSCHLFEKI